MQDVTTHGTLPAAVQLGDHVHVKANESEEIMRGTVVSIPAHRRFGVIQFEVQGFTAWGTKTLYSYQESWPIAPASRRY